MYKLELGVGFPTEQEKKVLMVPRVSQVELNEAKAYIGAYEDLWIQCTDKDIPQTSVERYIDATEVCYLDIVRSNETRYKYLISQQLGLYPSGLDNLVF